MKRERAPRLNQSSSEWFHISPGERFKLRTSAVETEGAYTMLEMMADSRYGTPMHIHSNEDEHFIVLEGTLHIANGDKIFDAPAGTTATVCKGVPHVWCNLRAIPLRMLIVFSPGGAEQMFREVAARDSDDIATILDRFGCRIVGPTLLEDVYTFNAPATDPT